MWHKFIKLLVECLWQWIWKNFIHNWCFQTISLSICCRLTSTNLHQCSWSSSKGWMCDLSNNNHECYPSWRWDSSVTIQTSLWSGWQMSCGSVPASRKRAFSLKCPYQLCGLRSLVFSGYWKKICWEWSSNVGAVLPLSFMPSRQLVLPTWLWDMVSTHVKVKFILWHAYVGTDGRQKYSSNSFATLAVEGGVWSAPHTIRQHCVPNALSLGKTLEGHRKSCPHHSSVPWLSGQYQVLATINTNICLKNVMFLWTDSDVFHWFYCSRRRKRRKNARSGLKCI